MPMIRAEPGTKAPTTGTASDKASRNTAMYARCGFAAMKAPMSAMDGIIPTSECEDDWLCPWAAREATTARWPRARRRWPLGLAGLERFQARS